MIELNHIYQGDALAVLQTLPDECVNCCVTSPPYYGLRDYGRVEQIGLEDSPELFIKNLVDVFREVRRVLKNDGTAWINIGDSYATNSGSYNSSAATGKSSYISKNTEGSILKRSRVINGLKSKDLIGIPWMLAFALRADGWYLRQDIIWHKPNPMPESVTDRCTKAHEYIFLLSKSAKYYFDQDAIRTPVKDGTVLRLMQQVDKQAGSNRVPGKTNGSMKAVGPGRLPRNGVDVRGGNQGSDAGIKAYSHRGNGDKKLTGHSGNFDKDGNLIGDGMANKKSVWSITTKPFKEAHFATFPEELPVDPIKAGCPEGGTVLDPFFGAGTTGLVARKLNRNFIGIELNPDYIKMADKRIRKQIGLFH